MSGDLRELAILVTGRHVNAQYEFFAHAPIGIDEGLDPAIVEAICTKQEPQIEDADTACVYHFAKALMKGTTSTTRPITKQLSVSATAESSNWSRFADTTR